MKLKTLVCLALVGAVLVSGCAPAAMPAPAQPAAATQVVAPAPAQSQTSAPAAAAPTDIPTPSPAAVQPPKAISLTDAMGKTLTLAGPAQRIVSLAPSSTEMLFAVGAGNQVVGRDTYSDYPVEVKDIPDIGGGFGELNLEVILSQKPDLAIASSLTAPEQVKALEDAGVPVFVLANPKDFNGMYTSLRTIAQITGHADAAATLIESLQKRVAAVESKLAGVKERPLVFYELDGTDPNAPWTPGPGTFIDTLIGIAGGENLGGSLSGEWVQISIEELIAKDPDLILIGDTTWGGVTLEDVKARSAWKTLSAIQNERLYSFDDNLVSRPGPRLVDGLETMALLLHPELFK
jgi:iron complex transport system substrate-binding protein